MMGTLVSVTHHYAGAGCEPCFAEGRAAESWGARYGVVATDIVEALLTSARALSPWVAVYAGALAAAACYGGGG